MNEGTLPLWIALLEVQPKGANSEHGPIGAYVNGITPATSGAKAVGKLSALLERLGWRVVTVHGVEDFGERCRAYEVELELQELAIMATRTGNPQLGAFHSWLSDDKPI